MKMFFVLTALFTCFFTFSNLIHADANFSISLSTTHTITDSGKAIVEQTYTLTNKKPDIYATQYSLETSSIHMKNITVKEGTNTLKANIDTTDKKTSIGITFPDKVVGEGKSRRFTIRFEDESSVIANGNILEVYVPKLSNVREFDSYQVQIVVPARYGLPTRVLPAKYTHQEDNDVLKLFFSEDLTQGVSALFGREQAYDFTLHYHLENPTSTTGIIQIALPPDTSFQRVFYESIEPKPKQLETDEDGNWIATFEIAAQKNVEVIAHGTAILSLSPVSEVRVPEPLPAHTTLQQYWETQDAHIKELAQKYRTPREIYEYVTLTLSYDYEKVNAPAPRLGAVQALAQPKEAVCQEFADLFITIARSAGIPARRATGYAFTNDNRFRPLSLEQEVLHAWPEYYDAEKKIWVPIDPTWGNTTGGLNYFDQLDVNHFVFAYNGLSSSQPYGAGAYKKKDQNSKDVEVKVAREFALPSPTFTLSLEPQSLYLSPLAQSFVAKVTNTSGVAAYQLPISAAGNFIHTQQSLGVQAPAVLDRVLPFQTSTFAVTFQPSAWWLSGPAHLTLRTGPVASSHDVTIGPLQAPIIIPFSVGISLAAGALIAWRLLVPRRKR